MNAFIIPQIILDFFGLIFVVFLLETLGKMDKQLKRLKRWRKRHDDRYPPANVL